MNAVDLWLIIAAILFGIGAVLSLPGVVVGRLNAVLFVASGLVCFVVSVLVQRN